MNSMDIQKMLAEAESGKRSAILSRITEEALPFWEGCEELVRTGRPIKPYVVSRLLKENFNIKISESAVKHHFQNVADNAQG
jgi:hypothetical protein